MITPSGKPITVAIADDHTLMRSALVNLIASSNNNYKVCIEAKNGKDLLDQLGRVGLTDIILLDISMPVMDGFETMTLLKEKYPDPKVIALTMYDHPGTIFKMFALGVKGYVLKAYADDVLLCALDAVAGGGQYFPGEANEQLRLASSDSFYRKKASLKEKELAFLRLLCVGMTYKEIAATMHVSYYTIKDYSHALFEKFGLKSKTELILFVLKYKLVEMG